MFIINTAPERHLRAVLQALCNDGELDTKINKMLGDLSNLETSFSGADTSTPDAAGSKRKLDEQGLEICVYCDNAFCNATNSENACRSHESDAEMEVDEEGDFWADHDEDCHGEIDLDELRKEYPNGYIWSCCDQKGSQPGCRKHPHKSRQQARPRNEGY
ncbi:hypothetical protein HJFPF1_11074 [Paramyrothecium foliicola]|nr:hypothetical protein HJFPF1_11074 [Paramyrothecium foliicola]